MFVNYPKLGSSPDDEKILDEADETAINRFMAAYTEYVKVLGSNTIETVAISHPVDDNGDFELTTLHIRLTGIGQTLVAVPVIYPESVDRIKDWLAEAFDEPLFEEGRDISLCELEIHRRSLTIEEIVPALEDISITLPMPVSVRINVLGSPVLATALYAFALLDADLDDEKTGEVVGQRLTTFAVADEPCPDCDEPMVIMRGVCEKLDQNGGRHSHRAFSQRLHKDEYHAFVLLLNDLCDLVGEDGFHSLSHEGLSEEDFMAAVGELHKEEMEGLASLMEGFAGALMETANPAGEEGEGKPTLH